MMQKNVCATVFDQYEKGIQFKNSITARGLYEQNKMNERFYNGDQWHGAKCGSERPLVRQNVIKRIGDYKISVIGSSPITVNYSAEGIPSTTDLHESAAILKNKLRDDKRGIDYKTVPDSVEINLAMEALSNYFKVTSERIGFESIKNDALKNAYISGTSVLYTYWDPDIKTGLYADAARTHAIKGDINCELLDVENVYFGDPNSDDIQNQPYIIVSRRESVRALRKEAKRNGISADMIDKIKADSELGFMAGDMSQREPAESEKATVLIKFYKSTDDNGGDTIKAVKVCKEAVIRPEWDLKIRLYPFSVFAWDKLKSCAYGTSEVEGLIPNQIAINRMITASVWSVMMMGMPIMVVNGSVVNTPITNDPGQIIKVYGRSEDMDKAIRYVNPPAFSNGYLNNIESLITETMSQSGAVDAAIGDVAPNNTSAIIAVRESATMPLQIQKSRFYQFCEETARIWAEYWLVCYGNRSLKINDENGTWYMPFVADRYRDLLISVKVDVGASTLWSEAQSIQTLDSLLSKNIIDVTQYLERMPKGIIPDVNGLLREAKENKSSEVAV